MLLLLIFAIAIFLPAILGAAVAKHHYGTIEHDDPLKDPYLLASGFAVVIATALFGAFAEFALELSGPWVRYLGGISLVTGIVGFLVGRLVVKDL